MRRTWQKAQPKIEKKFRVNHQITSPEVFLIDESGEKLGPTDLKKAIDMAIEAELDLVEVNPLGNPPVVKIMDYGQFKYEKEKKAHKQKVMQKKVETKEVRLSVRMASHDLDLRLDQAEKFLKRGQKLKVGLFLKGREKAHPEKAMEIINDFVKSLENKGDLSVIREQDLTKQGGTYTIILTNKND